MLDELIQRHPWPESRPDMKENWLGWLCPATADAIKSFLSDDTRLVVECGTWLGVSARMILNTAPNTHLICVDTWEGSPEHHSDACPAWKECLPTLYETCQHNLWPWKDRTTLIKADSLVGLGEVYAAGLTPDLIYVDTKHTFGRVYAELAVCLELFPTVPVVGDDYTHGAVKGAAQKHHADTMRPLTERGAAFSFAPWRQV